MNDPNTLNRLSVRRFQPMNRYRSVPVAGFMWLLLSLPLLGQSTIQFQSGVFTVAETAGQVALPVVRVNDLETDVAVEFYSITGSATAGQDFTAVSGTLSFAAGVTNQTINVPILNDALFEGLERFQVALTNATGGAVLGSMKLATVSIQDNDTGAHFESATYRVAEDVGSVFIHVNWVITDTDEPQTVVYTTIDGTALAGTDYEAASGTLTFGPGELIQRIPVVILNDGVKDPDKSFQLQLSNASIGRLGNPALITVTIQDPTPKIYAQPTPASQSVSPGAAVKIQVSAKGARMQWQHRAGESEFTDIPGATSQVVEFTNATVDLSGEYRIAVSSTTGESVTSQIATLTVDPTFIKITEGPVANDVFNSFMGSWGDYDGDGLLDLAVGGGGEKPAGASVQLYHNEGNAEFSRVLSGSLPNDQSQLFGGIWTDIDNDGDLDWRPWTMPPCVHLNDGQGNFSIREARELVPGGGLLPGGGGAIADYDHDGFLDVAMGNYEGPDYLLRNRGDGTFVPITNTVFTSSVNNVEEIMVWADFNYDGLIDLIAIGVRNRLYQNVGDGTFKEIFNDPVVEKSGAYQLDGSWADLDNDGYFELMLADWNSPYELYSYDGSSGFVRRYLPPLTTMTSSNADGSSWGDLDNDGDLDLFVAINIANTGQADPNNRLFVNNGDGTFTQIFPGSPVKDGGNSATSTWVDFDNDGFLDLFVANGLWAGAQRNFLYRNNLRNVGNSNGWLKVGLRGKASNGSGVGAIVRVGATIGGTSRWQMRQITAAVPDNNLTAHFGLGDATKVDTLRIQWPSGIVQELKDVAVNQHLEIVETQGVPPLEPMTFEAFGRDAQGVFQATVNCPVEGVLCVMEASSDFERWSKVQVRTNVTGTIEFTDAHAVDSPTRFYRVLVP